jgi:glycosyltransferase involved in cell wall biosynthesis
VKKVAGMLRVKNEARWIERVLKAGAPVCERIYVLDDHSTDGTQVICRSMPFEGTNETRDKNWLLERVEQARPDWVLHIDGDEEIEPGGCAKIRALVERGDRPDAYRFRFLYLWDRPDQIRTDRWYSTVTRISLFRLRPGARFQSMAGAGLHCGSAPEPETVAYCDVTIIHWGYLHREDRIRKYHWYNAPDKHPIPELEDGYRHMVIGDLFPADSMFRHAGPLRLEPLSL